MKFAIATIIVGLALAGFLVMLTSTNDVDTESLTERLPDLASGREAADRDPAGLRSLPVAEAPSLPNLPGDNQDLDRDPEEIMGSAGESTEPEPDPETGTESSDGELEEVDERPSNPTAYMRYYSDKYRIKHGPASDHLFARMVTYIVNTVKDRGLPNRRFEHLLKEAALEYCLGEEALAETGDPDMAQVYFDRAKDLERQMYEIDRPQGMGDPRRHLR